MVLPGCSNGMGEAGNGADQPGDERQQVWQQAYAEAMQQHIAQAGSDAANAADSLDVAILAHVYQKRSYQTLLPLADNRQHLLRLVASAAGYGLDPLRYAARPFPGNKPQVDSIQAAAWDEWQLVSGLLHFGRDVATRKSSDTDSLWEERQSQRLHALLEATPDSLALQRALMDLQPVQPPYRALLRASMRFVRHFPLEDSTAQVPLQRTDSLQAHTIARGLLQWRGFLPSDSAASDSAYLSALRQFQVMNGLQPDAKIGALTAKALGQSNRNRWRHLAVALDRWRSEPAWPQPFALVNIPAFTLQLFDGDSIIAEHRVVVGTRATPTPQHSSSIHTVVAYPYWNVPYSIATAEILPKVKQDISYLSRNHYRVLSRSGAELDAGSVPWADLSAGLFPYLIRQEGGSSNALGLVKFLFQNPYSIYLHDTNARNLFARESRAFSHGCIRVERPMELASYLLGRSELPGDMAMVEQSINDKKERFIRLDPGLAIHLRYFTAHAGTDGWPVFNTDVYGLDAAYKLASE